MSIEYPQRWLREAEAVTSPQGWRKQVTNELLKCQKGLEVPEEPEEPVATLKSVSVTGLSESATIVEGAASFTLNYSYLDAEYTPTSVECTVTSSGDAVVETVKGDGTFTVNVTGAVNDEVLSVTVVIDSVSSDVSTVTLTETP